MNRHDAGRDGNRDRVREGVVRTGRTSSNLGRQPDPMPMSHSRRGLYRDHVREGVVRTGRRSSNLGRQPDSSRRRPSSPDAEG